MATFSGKSREIEERAHCSCREGSVQSFGAGLTDDLVGTQSSLREPNIERQKKKVTTLAQRLDGILRLFC